MAQSISRLDTIALPTLFFASEINSLAIVLLIFMFLVKINLKKLQKKRFSQYTINLINKIKPTLINIKLNKLEDDSFLEQIYSNISEMNNHFANVDLIVKQYMELI